ncbi:unnamed protein product [Durusdinium trenchii]|uniref:Uncharacterized protein n=1 Tax=Durusdinium trenchii TaxID=1381693 RepID=A0ABP0KB52_9DINO
MPRSSVGWHRSPDLVAPSPRLYFAALSFATSAKSRIGLTQGPTEWGFVAHESAKTKRARPLAERISGGVQSGEALQVDVRGLLLVQPVCTSKSDAGQNEGVRR